MAPALLAVVVTAASAGCGLVTGPDDAGGRGSPASSTAPAPAPPAPVPPGPGAASPAPADAAAVRSAGVAVVAGGTTVLHVLAPDPSTSVRIEPDGDEAVLTLDPGTATAPVDVLLAVPDGATVQVEQDGSLLVLAADGTFLGGAGRPAPGPGADAAAGTPRVTAVDDGLVRLEATGQTTARLGSVALLGTDWGEREGGRSLAVEPSAWARAAGLAGEAAVWAEVVAAEPGADTAVMRDQLVCHTVGAPDKATWNLEPWRPDVGLLAVMLAGCNPT